MRDSSYAAALLIERLVQDSYPDRQPSAMKPLQWSILRYLKSVDGKPVDVTTVAKYLGRTNAPISRAVTTLESRGLLEKGNTVGSASVAITLTDSGMAVLDSDPMRRFASWITDLPENERETLLRAVRSMTMIANKKD